MEELSKFVRWNKTGLALERLQNENPFFEEPDEKSPRPRLYTKPLIMRDSPINGGIYVGSQVREAIIVDDAFDPELDKAFQDFFSAFILGKEACGQVIDEFSILEDVFAYTKELIPFDKENDIMRMGFGPDESVLLGYFISKRIGQCRHTALFIAYVLERLKKTGHCIKGHISIDRNSFAGIGGHAWVRYTNPSRQIVILDAALSYLGLLHSMSGPKWFYYRPDECPDS